MSVFICAKCGCLENTACCSVHFMTIPEVSAEIEFSPDMEQYRGKKLCSVCARLKHEGKRIICVAGKWHGRFERRMPTDEERIDIQEDEIWFG